MLLSQKKAILLLSGGLDSATCFAIAKAQGYEVHALSFDYGQRHKEELRRASLLAQTMGAAEHRVATIDLRLFGGSALTEEAIAVPKHDRVEDIGKDIPVTYVPARNTIFLSFALAYAEVVGALDIFLGVNALDYSGYPDCRPEYIAAYEAMANLALAVCVGRSEPVGEQSLVPQSGLAPQQVRGDISSGLVRPEGSEINRSPKLTLHTPLLHLTKAQIIAKGLKLGVDYSLTISCYDPSPEGSPCGQCDACLLRAKGFAEHGMVEKA